MSIVTQLTEHLRHPPLNEDGEPYGTTLRPPLDEAALRDLERRYGCSFSAEVRELLSYCGGLEEGPMEAIDFRGEDIHVPGFASLDGRIREIGADGFGNFWFYWSTGVTSELGPIYYYQHEGPMLFYQSARLVDFVAEYLRFMTPPYRSLIDDVHEFRIKPIRDLNLDLIPRAEAVISSDSELRQFAGALPDDALFYDFRRAKIGDGVDLQKLHLLAVHPRWPLIAVRRKKSLLRWLFGTS